MILLSPKGESRVKKVLHLILWHYLPKSNVGIGITYKLLPLFRITLELNPSMISSSSLSFLAHSLPRISRFDSGLPNPIYVLSPCVFTNADSALYLFESFMTSNLQKIQKTRNVYKLVNRTTAPQVLDLCKSKRSAALEILLKDYASFLHPDKRDEILKMELGNCIKQYIDSEAIQVFANRASWLGNDQLHYTRTWTELDIFDLETLVEQSITAIELEEKKKRLLKDMPKPGKKQ